MNIPTELFEAAHAWRRWSDILQRIISHSDYRYESDKKYPLIKLAQFASNEMGHFNNKKWRIAERAGPKVVEWLNKETLRDNQLAARVRQSQLTRWRAAREIAK